MALPIPSLNLSAPTSAESAARSNATQGQDATGGAGNRGFINNFAAAGANLRAEDINGPAFRPERMLLAAGLIGAAGLVGVILWRKYGAR